MLRKDFCWASGITSDAKWKRVKFNPLGPVGICLPSRPPQWGGDVTTEWRNVWLIRHRGKRKQPSLFCYGFLSRKPVDREARLRPLSNGSCTNVDARHQQMRTQWWLDWLCLSHGGNQYDKLCEEKEGPLIIGMIVRVAVIEQLSISWVGKERRQTDPDKFKVQSASLFFFFFFFFF